MNIYFERSRKVPVVLPRVTCGKSRFKSSFYLISKKRSFRKRVSEGPPRVKGNGELTEVGGGKKSKKVKKRDEGESLFRSFEESKRFTTPRVENGH